MEKEAKSIRHTTSLARVRNCTKERKSVKIICVSNYILGTILDSLKKNRDVFVIQSFVRKKCYQTFWWRQTQIDHIKEFPKTK